MTVMERVLILGDIHANDAALAAVLSDAADRYRGQPPRIWFLGDLFGRGPQPARAYRRLMSQNPEALIAGNHEGGLIGRFRNARNGGIVSGPYNKDDWEVLERHRQELCAQELLQCHQDAMSGELFDFVSRLPVICSPRPAIYMVHGGLESTFAPPGDLSSFLDRLVWEYTNTPARAAFTLAAMQWVAEQQPADARIVHTSDRRPTPELVLVGHWHARLLYDSAGAAWRYPPQLNTPYALGGRPVLLSPGSVGFPRQNGELDASYCLLTLVDGRPAEVAFHTVAYDRQAVRDEMVRKEYPEATVKRLRLPGETETVIRRSSPRRARQDAA